MDASHPLIGSRRFKDEVEVGKPPEQCSGRRRYFFFAFARVVFFFAGAFFATFLTAFFTIAALLAIMMAVVEQCPRESRAPRPDYYRTRKKTRFPLNELFTSGLLPCSATRADNVL
jgi:hypothetical protein